MGDSLIIRIGAKANEFDKELQRLKQKTKSFEKGLAKTAKISAAAFVGLATAVGVATNKFAKFEKGFTNVQTLLDKSSFKTKTLTKGINDLKSGVLSLGAESGESFEVLNKGLFDIVSAGIDAEESINVLTVATELAAAGATDTAVAVDGLTSAMNAYGLTADDAAVVAQKFFLAQKGGKTTVEELSSGFGLVAASTQAFGVSLDELLASVSAVTLGGVKTRSAYTGLNAVLANISAPTKEAAKEAARLGVAFDSQALRAQGLKGFMDSLTGSANFNQQSLEKLFGSVEAKKFVFALAGSQAEAFANQLENLGDKTQLATTFQEALAVKQATTDKAVKRATQSFNALAIQLGERFAPLINEIADSLGAMAKEFNKLDDETKDSIATFIKWGLAITAGITTLATGALIFIKVTAFISALSSALAIAAPIATAFWLALTGPVGLAVVGIAAVVGGIFALSKALGGSDKPKTLDEINKALEEQRKALENNKRIAEETGKDPSQSIAVQQIQDRIDKLEELRKKQIETASGDAGGAFVMAPTTDGTDPMAGIEEMLTGRPPIEVPFKPVVPAEEQAKLDQEAIDAAKKTEDAKTTVVSEEVAKRRQAARDEQEILKAKNEELSNEEIDFIKRRQALKAEAAEIEGIKDQELKAIELENLGLQNEMLLAEEQEFFLRKQEEKAIQREQEAVLQEELNALSQEQRDLLNEKEIEDLRSQIMTKQQVKQLAAKQEVQENIKGRNQFLKDELAHGKSVATIKQFLNSSEVTGAAQTAGQLTQLQNSKNKTLKSIGKRAAQAQIAIDTARGALSAYTSLSGIPIVGPALGAAAAGALIAYGGERLAQVNAAQRGGFVPNGAGGSRDRVPMMLEPNELVVPKALAPDFIQSVGRPDAQGGETEDARSNVVEIAIEDDATDFITAKQRENTDLAIGVA